MSDQHASLSRAELEAQIAEFEARGGKVEEVPAGVSAEYTPVARDFNLAEATNSKNEKKRAIKSEGYCTVYDIARWAGSSDAHIKTQLRRHQIEVKKKYGRAQFYDIEDGRRLAKMISDGEKIISTSVSLPVAADMFGFERSRFSELIRLGKITLKPSIIRNGAKFFDKKQTEKAANEYRKRQNSIT